MELDVQIKEEEEYLSCIVNGPFSPENALKTLQMILAATAKSKKYKTIINATSVKESAPALTKVLAAAMISSDMTEYEKHYGQMPRIAFIATEPFHIPSYSPVTQHFDALKIPIKIFMEYEDGLNWLLNEHS